MRRSRLASRERMNKLIIIGLIVVAVGAILISVRVRRRREDEDPQSRADRLQRGARRYSRMLVSEIKLYNEARVADGRQSNDLYHELREEIDRSRKMYDKANDSLSDHDYFHQALVEILCDGDAGVLGAEYPGPQEHTVQ